MLVIGVSADSLDENQRFATANGITFPLVSDTDRKIRKRYGRGRVTYLIDKNGVIRLVQKGVPDNVDFIKALDGLN